MLLTVDKFMPDMLEDSLDLRIVLVNHLPVTKKEYKNSKKCEITVYLSKRI